MNREVDNFGIANLYRASLADDVALISHAFNDIESASTHETVEQLHSLGLQVKLRSAFIEQKSAIEELEHANSTADQVSAFIEAFREEVVAPTMDYQPESTRPIILEAVASNQINPRAIADAIEGQLPDSKWLTSRAHMIRDSVTESLWTIVQEIESDGDAEEIADHYRIAQENLQEAITGFSLQDEGDL